MTLPYAILFNFMTLISLYETRENDTKYLEENTAVQEFKNFNGTLVFEGLL